jgi:hypothetical protein
MSEVNWVLILKLKELRDYLDYSDVKQVGKVNKSTYNSYKSTILNELNINQKFVNKLSVNGNCTDNPFVDLFYYEYSIKSVADLIKIVNVEQIDIYSNFNSLFLSLPNVTSLTLWNIQIDLPILIKSVSYLNKLTSIKFQEIKIYINDSLEPDSYDLKLPLKLKEIEIINVFWVLVFGGKNTRIFLRYQRDLFERGPFLNSSKLTYPGLKYLRFNSQPSLGPAIFNNFITNNLELENLGVDVELLNTQSYTLISQQQSLKSLTLFNSHGGVNLESFELPQFLQVQKLAILYKNLTGNYSSVGVFAANCENVTKLTIQYFKDHNSVIAQVISQFHKLSELILIDPYKNQSLQRLTLTNPSIQSLKLQNFPLKNFDIKLFESLVKLKYIQLQGHSQEEWAEMKDIFENFIDWKLIKLGNRARIWRE